jgi:hypothetical protein
MIIRFMINLFFSLLELVETTVGSYLGIHKIVALLRFTKKGISF